MSSSKDQGSSLALSELTPDGVREFERLLVRARDGMTVSDGRAEAQRIASDAQFSTVVDRGIEVHPDHGFQTRAGIAEYFDGLLPRENFGPASGRERMWSWLALLFLHQICREKSGQLAVRRDLSRYIANRNQQRFYRHLIAFPVWIRRQYGELARVFLVQEPFIMPDVVEQIASRPDLATSRAVIEVIDRLYWDAQRGELKPRAMDKGGKGQPPPPGTLRALDLVLSQMACTHDVRSMSAGQLLEKLPPEFDAFR